MAAVAGAASLALRARIRSAVASGSARAKGSASAGGGRFVGGAVSAGGFVLVALLLVGGCAAARLTVADAFPDAQAAPWRRREPVWQGTFEQAREALGADADALADLAPQRIWLAVYDHPSRPGYSLTVRAYAFDSIDNAHKAFVVLRPVLADALTAGDEGCWTDDGILVRWGRLLFDLFATLPDDRAAPERTMFVFSIIERNMTDALASDPQ